MNQKYRSNTFKYRSIVIKQEPLYVSLRVFGQPFTMSMQHMNDEWPNGSVQRMQNGPPEVEKRVLKAAIRSKCLRGLWNFPWQIFGQKQEGILMQQHQNSNLSNLWSLLQDQRLVSIPSCYTLLAHDLKMFPTCCRVHQCNLSAGPRGNRPQTAQLGGCWLRSCFSLPPS